MTPPSHGGGVVVRKDAGQVRFLLVSARRQPDEWVLPKGHIDPGETAETTAAREVLEEAGVVASVTSALDVIEFDTGRGRVRAQFFLMTYERDGATLENRRRAWLPVDEALAALRFDDMRHLIMQAHTLIAAAPE